MAKFPTMEEFAKQAADLALDEFQYDGKTIREWIELILSGKLVEVVHAEWELHGNDDDLSGSYFCSKCGYNMDESEYLDNFSSLRYCPYCGAKMKKEA